jgi:hypothetical protein
MTVGEAIAEIREKTKIGGPDHGLFQAKSTDPKAGVSRWLKENKTLIYYGLINGVS